MEHVTRLIRALTAPPPTLTWQHAGDGVLISGRYKIIADRHTWWENDLLVDGEYCMAATSVDRLMRIAAKMERKK